MKIGDKIKQTEKGLRNIELPDKIYTVTSSTPHPQHPNTFIITVEDLPEARYKVNHTFWSGYFYLAGPKYKKNLPAWF